MRDITLAIILQVSVHVHNLRGLHLLVSKPHISYFYDAYFRLFEHKFVFISKHIPNHNTRSLE